MSHGNLQTLLVLLGTEYFPEMEGKILFIEESEDEDTQMVHRFLTQLEQTGALKKISALMIGRFCEQTGFNDSDSLGSVLGVVLDGYDIPVVYDLDFGHSDPMFTVPNGGYCVIDTAKEKILMKKAVK